MKIRRVVRGGARAFPFMVTGPDYEHTVASEGAAIATATARAGLTGSTHYVREHGDIIGRAEHDTDTGVAQYVPA